MNKVIIVHYEEDPVAIEQFRINSQRLWAEHIGYTRNAIISIMADLPDIQAVTNRLMKNQEDIGQLIAPYHGEESAKKLTDLLKEHIAIAADIFKNIKSAGSTTALETKWKTNVDAIADLLDALDPINWPKQAVIDMLTKHLACTTREAVARYAKNWEADISAYDDCSKEIAILASAMANGILDTFPEGFVIAYHAKTLDRKAGLSIFKKEI